LRLWLTNRDQGSQPGQNTPHKQQGPQLRALPKTK